jgi:hypothetical protein
MNVIRSPTKRGAANLLSSSGKLLMDNLASINPEEL